MQLTGCDPERRKTVTYGTDSLRHIAGADGADTADTEGFRPRQLAGVEDEASLTYEAVQGPKVIMRTGRSMKGDNDRCLNRIRQECLQAQRPHAIDQTPAVVRVTAGACRQTSVIFTAVLGTHYLREKMGGLRIASAMLVATGAVAIRYSG